MTTDTPIANLLPLRGVTITLEFIQPARLRIFHHAALTAFLRGLLDSPPEFNNLLVIDAPETGRTHYQPGDHYNFTIIALREGGQLLQQALDRLRRLPFSAPRNDSWLPLRDNLRFVRVRDLLTGQRVARAADCTPYSTHSLLAETALWQAHPSLQWRWLSPARLSRPPENNDKPKRKPFPYCRNATDIDGQLLLQRCHQAIINLVERRSGSRHKRPPAPPLPSNDTIAFWLDNHYQQPDGHRRKLGGMGGSLTIQPPADLSTIHWQALVLGQYIGIGENRAFGLGRYRLYTPDGAVTAHRSLPAHPLIRSVTAWDNLTAAYREVRARAGDRNQMPRLGDPLTTTVLQNLQRQLNQGHYRPATLELVLDRKQNGQPRVLAIPRWEDRVAQRAVSRVLAPGLDNAFHPDSHGYRKGHSRFSASDAIRQAYSEGYRWLFESDIEDFFPSVRWNHLEARLRMLYGDDPLVDLMMAWVKAPMTWQGRRLKRDRGLPQGSSLSPLFANLLLDDFDRDLEAAGFRMIRYADDFIILSKNPERAQSAQETVERSLAELDLTLKPEKTAVRHFRDGFRFLGLLFLNDLVLETHTTSTAPQDPLSLPPEWLAMLADRPARQIDKTTPLPEKAPPKSPSPPAPTNTRANDHGITIIVSGEPSLLQTRQQHLLVTRDDEPIIDQPWSAIGTVMLFGPQHITTPALRAAMRHGVTVHFASTAGRYQGAAANPRAAGQGSALWLKQLDTFGNTEKALQIAAALVKARIRHMREVLRQGSGDHGETRQAMKRLAANIPRATSLTALNGLEGKATALYFASLQTWLDPEWGFEGRRRRPAPDPFNALLNLGYTVLYNTTDSLLRADGLLPEAGCYHQGMGTHAALASDMMEPFRHFIERTAIKALNSRRLKPDDFSQQHTRGTRLTGPAVKRYLAMIAQRLDSPIRALGNDSADNIHQQLHRQNLSLIASIRGTAEFQPFLQR